MNHLKTGYEHPFYEGPNYIYHIFECEKPNTAWNIKMLKLLGWFTWYVEGSKVNTIIIYLPKKKAKDILVLYFYDKSATLLCRPGDKVYVSKTYIGGQLTQTMIQESKDHRPIFGINENKEGYAAF